MRARLLRGRKAARKAPPCRARIENAEQREATAEDALGGALELYNGSLSFEPKGFDAKRVAGRVAGDS